MSRRHLINSSDVFVMKGFTVYVKFQISNEKFYAQVEMCPCPCLCSKPDSVSIGPIYGLELSPPVIHDKIVLREGGVGHDSH